MIEERYKQLAWHLEKISGYDITSNTDTRVYPLPILRAMVYKQLHDEGYSFTAIEKAVGKDHSTIVHIIQTLVGIIEYPTNKDEALVAIYNSFIDKCGSKINIELTPIEFGSLKNILERICKRETD